MPSPIDESLFGLRARVVANLGVNSRQHRKAAGLGISRSLLHVHYPQMAKEQVRVPGVKEVEQVL